jgi:hypothetical protein
LRNRSTGGWSMFLARKFLGPNRELLGRLVGGPELKSFENYFDTAAQQIGIDIALVRGDGTLLAQYPHVESAMGRLNERTPTNEAMHARSDWRFGSRCRRTAADPPPGGLLSVDGRCRSLSKISLTCRMETLD